MPEQSTISVFAPSPVVVTPGGARRVDIDELQNLNQTLLGREHGRVWLRNRNSGTWSLVVRLPGKKDIFKDRVPFLNKKQYPRYEDAAKALVSNPYIMWRLFGPRPIGDGTIPHLGPYDGVWFPNTDRGTRTVRTHDFLFRKTNYVSPASYRYTLNTEDNPITFIRKSKLFHSAGIENTLKFERSIVSGLTEILRAKSLKDVSHLLEEAKYEDLIDVRDSYRVLLNRTLPQVGAEINSDIRVEIECYNQIPESLQGQGYIVDPINPLQFIYRKNLTKQTQKELQTANLQATAVVRANLNKIEHQILVLDTPDAPYERHPEMEDPANNPYLVYDPIQSEQRGEVIFVNVAQNKNIAFRSVPKYTTGDRYSLDIMKKTADYRESQRRRYDPETGEIIKAAGTEPKKESILPWVAGGILAAYGVSQVI